MAMNKSSDGLGAISDLYDSATFLLNACSGVKGDTKDQM